ncbi:hypothetical protein [Novosphingobium umbonatum]|uniref:hypothetical protein n=1 Tax=Novosphingobium umbonatum TaxID=1908524 RepID=UPI001FE2B754|nr:hypothetical protein [Novosphingobium umbonatum]
MLRVLVLALLFAALLGLVGQEAAFAQMNFKAAQDQQEQMDPDCAKAMGITLQTSADSQPCHGLTPECIAKMGCAIPLAVLPPLAVEPVRYAGVGLLHPAPAIPLADRSFGPEPEPPTHLS